MGNSDRETDDQANGPSLARRTKGITAAPTDSLVARPRAQLIVLAGEQTGRRIPLHGETVLGRSTAASVCLPDPHISREHARIWLDDDRYMLEDLGSHNGTAINGRPIDQTPAAVSFGDKIRVGKNSMLLFTRYDDLEAQILQSQKLQALGQLAGGVAHEFNNLLAVVVGNVGVVRSAVTDPETLACLDDIQTASNRAAALNRQLLNFSSRGQSGHRITDMSRLTEEVCELARRTFPRAVQIDASLSPELQLIGDPAQLHQVLMNLFINGRDAMPEGGTLTVRLSRLEPAEQAHPLTQQEPQVLLTIEDTGPGLDEETRRRVFEPFAQAKERRAGNGLGLSTVNTIVHNHGGKLTLESALGEGSRFQILLPLVQPVHSREQFQTMALHKRDHGTILVVDDEALVASTIVRLLQSLGYQAVPATTLDQALEVAKEQLDELQLILLDATMPEHDGARAFDALKDLGSIPIVILSGFDHDEGADALLDAGAADLLNKPFTREALKKTLSRCLGADLGDLNEVV